jgi:hypothetical protein
MHPKFAHLETETSNKEIYFKVFIANDKIYLVMNNKVRYGGLRKKFVIFKGSFL